MDRIDLVSSSRFEFKGDLSVTPLPEVLQTVHHYRVPGVLTASHDGVEKKIFIWSGDVIFASSGDRSDSLGDYLLRTGRITQAQFDESIEILLFSGGNKRHGEVLADMGILSEASLFEIVVAQVRSIVYSLFDWESGEVSFQVGQYATDELIQLNIPTRQVILAGVKSMKDPKRVVGLLGPSWTIFDASYAPHEIQDVGLAPAEVQYLEKVNGVKTLKELIAMGPGDAVANAKLMYAFFALKLVSRREMTQRSIKKIQWKTAGGDYAGE